jgi:hypothetical protein
MVFSFLWVVIGGGYRVGMVVVLRFDTFCPHGKIKVNRFL